MSNPQLLILIGVLITAITSIIVAVINVRQTHAIAQIHIMVNDRLDRALARIEDLKDELKAIEK